MKKLLITIVLALVAVVMAAQTGGALSTLLSQHGVATTLCLADRATEP